MNTIKNTNITAYISTYTNEGLSGHCSILTGTGNKGYREKMLIGQARDSSDNKATMVAVIETLQAITKPCKIDIVTNNDYLVDCFADPAKLRYWAKNDWRKVDSDKRVNNYSLWKEIVETAKTKKVFMHVKKSQDEPTMGIAYAVACECMEALKD